MILIYIALPVALLIAGGAVAAFIWAARSDQYEDLDTPPQRMLLDDPPISKVPSTAQDDPAQSNSRNR